MEPISYCMRLTDLNIGLGFYVLSKREFSLPSVHESLYDRKRNRLYLKFGIDADRIEFLKKETSRLRQELYQLP